MKLAFRTFAIAAAMLLVSLPALADWNPGDPFKMHYPQLPDPSGWDVQFTHNLILADDWLCTGSGSVSDIHFWFSARGDQQFDPSQIHNIHVSIHDDIPADQNPLGYSTPGNLLWQRDIQFGQFQVRPYGEGTQGWYDPSQSVIVPNDHHGIWQANITGIADPFLQKQGNIYWLDLTVTAVDVFLGWKTSGSPHFNDDAVWRPDVPGENWRELRDPLNSQSLDLAFVIVPEPGGALLLLCAGGTCLAALAARRRSAGS